MGPPPSKVYIVMHSDPAGATVVLGVFAVLQDANDECFSRARAEDVTLTSESSTTGPSRDHMMPIEPVRWDTADGVSCWVQGFDVIPRRIASPDII